MNLRWRFGVIAGIFLAIFCLYPQMNLIYLRGGEWNGHYAYNDIDEVAYASYINALIDGRPRKNDPYTGRDDSAAAPQPESLFSIQFAAPYSIALPARILGIGTPWAMTISGAVAGFLAALAAFWLLALITRDWWFAMAGSLVVFCGGAVFAGEGAMAELFFDGFSYPYFPGFRRYIPAMAMAAIFGMFAFLWKMLDRPADDSKITNRGYASPTVIFGTLAAFCFAYTVYSYFFIWTTAAAWLGCLVLVWLAERPEGWKADLKRFVFLGLGCLASLVPYAYLLSKRAESMDNVQLLVHSRAPDLFRVPEYIAFAVLLLLIFGMALKIISIKERATLLALSLALVPFVVFNQQIITGRSLQPIHYQVFIGNYVAGLALVLTIGILLRGRIGTGRLLPKIAFAGLALIAIGWGFIECFYTVRVLDEANVIRDEALPVAKRLTELAKSDPDPHRTTVLSFDGIFADDMPSVAPQNILWARHQHVFAGLTWEESKERYYQYLFYNDVDEKRLEKLLRTDFVTMIALFGWGRHSDRLSIDATPLTPLEITQEVIRYGQYREDFGREQAAAPLISYVVSEDREAEQMEQLNKWYELDAGEQIGNYVLYKAKLRP